MYNHCLSDQRKVGFGSPHAPWVLSRMRQPGGWDYNRVLHLEPCGFGSLIRLRSQTAPGLQFSRYRRLAGYFNHTPMYQATALRSESRKNTRPHSVRDCRRYSRLICGSTRVRIPPRRVAKKETISDQGTYHGTAVGLFHAFSVE